MSEVHQPPLILFVAFPRMNLLDLTGPQTVFWAAGKYMRARGMTPYERHTVSLHGGPVASEEGIVIDTQPVSAFAGRAVDTIVVPGASEVESVLDEVAATVGWLRQAARQARRTTSVCTGAFLLAQAGLLDGLRVATHWRLADQLERRFATLDVDRDAIFVVQDRVWTSAGVTSGIDLALALVEQDCGRAVAMDVARELVVYMKRPGGQPQRSEMLRAQERDGAAFDELHAWLLEHLHDTGLTVDRLAERARMSARNFARVYKAKTGRSPGKAIESLRIEAARRMLAQSDAKLDRIARACGFGSEERMRVSFLRHTGSTPSELRKQLDTRA